MTRPSGEARPRPSERDEEISDIIVSKARALPGYVGAAHIASYRVEIEERVRKEIGHVIAGDRAEIAHFRCELRDEAESKRGLVAEITRLRQERDAVLRCVQAALGAVQHGSYDRMRDVVEAELMQALEEAGEIPPSAHAAGVKVETEVRR